MLTRRRFYFLPFLLFLVLNLTNSDQLLADQTDWTEEKIGKLAVKADHAATRKKWGQAIKYGERALEGRAALNVESDPNYISCLKTLNRYYDKAGRLRQVAERVKKAYALSKKHLEPTHNTSKINRLLYYKLLIAEKDYQEAIPVVLENISLPGSTECDLFRKLHYLEQLYSLYGLTSQLKEQEAALIRFLELNEQLLGSDDEDSTKVRVLLAKNYCRQKKLDKFDDLKKKYDLQYICK